MAENMGQDAGHQPIVETAEDDLLTKIRKEILKSGYPLELAAADLFEGAGWIITNNPVYFDVDEAKHREYDLSGLKLEAVHPFNARAVDLSVVASGHIFGVSAVVECKRSEKPWVFFTRRSSGPDYIKLSFTSPIANLLPMLPDQKSIFDPAFLSACLWHQSFARAKTFYEPFKGSDYVSQIWTAAWQLCKAIGHQKKQYEPWKTMTIWFVPIILFDGRLVIAKIDGGEVYLDEADHVTLEFSYLSAENPLKTETMLIDVLNSSALLPHLDRLDHAASAMVATLRDSFANGTISLGTTGPASV